MRISIEELAGQILAGAAMGRAVLIKLLERSSAEPLRPEALYLDFTGVHVATASYLRESVLTFRDVVRARRSNWYPVVANANAQIGEELSELLHSRGDVIGCCEIDEAGQLTTSGMLGRLDEKQELTFELLTRLGEADAAEMMRSTSADEIGQTAWNNRLAALSKCGVAMELSRGRTKRYRPIFQES